MAGQMFVGHSQGPVPVRLEGEELEQAIEDGWVERDPETGEVDTIYILKKMNYGQKQKLIGMGSKMSVNKEDMAAAVATAKASGGTGEGAEPTMDAGFDLGAYQTELLVLNVVSWGGPSFKGVPVTRENILDLDPDNPLVDKVLVTIRQLNKKRAGGKSPK